MRRCVGRGLLAALLILTGMGFQKAPTPVVPVLQTGHSNSVLAVRYSPDGKQLVSAGVDGNLILWDTGSGKMVRYLALPGERFSALDWTPDGKSVIAATEEEARITWDLDTGQSVSIPNGVPAVTRAIACHPTRPWVAIAGSETRVVDRTNGGMVFQARDVYGRLITWDRAGKHLAVATNQKRCLVWSVSEAGAFSAPVTISLTTPSPLALAFSPEGNQVRVVEAPGILAEYNVATGKSVASVTLETGKDPINGGAFSPDGKRFIANTPYAREDNNRLRLYDTATGKPLFQADPIGATSVTFSPDGARIATEDFQCLKIYETDRLTPRETWNFIPTRVFDLQFLPGSNPNNPTLATFTFDTLLWDLKSAALSRRILSGINCHVFTPDGKMLISASNVTGGPSTLQVQPIAAGNADPPPLETRTSNEMYKALAVTPDGKTLFVGKVGEKGSTVDVWNLPTRQKTGSISIDGVLFEIAVSPDGRLLAVGVGKSNGKSGVELRDIKSTGTVQKILPLRSPPLIFSGLDGMRLYFSADSRYLAGQVKREAVEGWDLQAGTLLPPCTGDDTGTLIGFLPDGKTLVTGATRIGDLLFFEAVTGRLLRRASEVEPGSAPISAGAVHPQGKWIATTPDGPETTLWDLAKGRPVVRMFARDAQNHLSMGGVVPLNQQEAYKHLPLDYVMMTPEGYYTGTHEAVQEIGFRIGSRTAVGFDLLDLWFNRPDKVLEALGGAETPLAAGYREAYQKRLARAGYAKGLPSLSLDQLPSLRQAGSVPAQTAETQVRFPVEWAPGGGGPLARLRVTINGVPIAFSCTGAGGWTGQGKGSAGLIIPSGKGTAGRIELTVPLDIVRRRSLDTETPNTIAVWATDTAGNESLRLTIPIQCTAPAPEQNLYVLAVGVSQYKDTRYNLHFADKDARQLASLFAGGEDPFGVRFGARFKKIYQVVLTDAEATRAKVLAARTTLEKIKESDTLIVFFAGHGLLDTSRDYYFATYDTDFTDPKRTALSYDEIENLLDGLPVRRKLLLLDTCHAGESDTAAKPAPTSATSSQGVARGVTERAIRGVAGEVADGVPGQPSSFTLMQGLFVDFQRGSGTEVIAAAAGAEFAYEERGNGVFTATLLEGLRRSDNSLSIPADLNGDGIVTVSELRDYATGRVVELTGGRQRPTARRENLTFDMAIYP